MPTIAPALLPTALTAGQTLAARYDAPGATAASLALRGPSVQNVAADLSTPDTIGLSADTTTWAPGLYAFELWATIDDENQLVHSGQLEVKASIGTDQRYCSSGL